MEKEKERAIIILRGEKGIIYQVTIKPLEEEKCFGCGGSVIVGDKICSHCGMNLMSTYV